jgi:hypothetical protein
LAAVNIFWQAIQFIQNPTQKVIQLARSKGFNI